MSDRSALGPDLGRVVHWTSVGPVAAQFEKSTAIVRGLMGPIGSGKTSTIAKKLLDRALEQRVHPSNRVRIGDQVVPVARYRCLVVHATYARLWANLLPTWWKWFPKEQGEWVGGNGGAATHTIRLNAQDPVTGRVVRQVEMRVDFVAIGDLNAEDVLRGYETTDIWMNEADLHGVDTYTNAVKRLGRFPDQDDGGCNGKALFLDHNAPKFGSWLLKIKLKARAGGEIEWYVQPAAVFRVDGGGWRLNPDAENLAKLDPAYYADQLKILDDDDDIARMLGNEPGHDRTGKPIYPQFRDSWHVAAADLAPWPNLDLLLGGDGGRTPAVVIAQRNPATTQWRVLDEVCAEGMGAEIFSDVVNAFLGERYADWTTPRRGMLDRVLSGAGIARLPIKGWADPATNNEGETDERTWLKIMRKRTGIDWRPCETNVPTRRWAAVRHPLTRTIDGGQPMILVSPRCEVLREGFGGGYRFRRLQIAHDERYTEEADKNRFSHPHDALQYLMVGAGGFDDVMERKSARANPNRQRTALTDDD